MNAWKIILATILIFGSGVVTGGLLVRRTSQTESPRQGRLPAVTALHPTAPGGLPSRVPAASTAGTEPEPRSKGSESIIFSQSQERTKQLMEPVTPHLREELDRAKREFSEILTPPQRLRFDELLKQRAKDQRRDKGSHAQEKDAPVEQPSRSPAN